MSEDIDKLGFTDRIKVFFATLSCLAVGGFLTWGPVETIDKKFEYFRELGIGFLAFGGIFGLILITEGSASGAGREINFRLKSLMLMLATGVIGGLLLIRNLSEVIDCWRLGSGGKAVAGTIIATGHTSGYKNKRIARVHVRYAGETKKWFDGVGRKRQPFGVVYLPGDPDTARRGEEGDGFLDLLDRGTGKWATLGLLAFGALCALFSPVKAKHFFFGRSEAAHE